MSQGFQPLVVGEASARTQCTNQVLIDESGSLERKADTAEIAPLGVGEFTVPATEEFFVSAFELIRYSVT